MWVSELGFVPADSLLQMAIKAVEKIANQSELRELWEESPSYTKWQKEIELLLAGLRAGQNRPAPTRKPKPPSARLSLPKLIEKIDPDEESPLREKLRQKLEAIADVNVPLGYDRPPLILIAERGLIPEAQRLIKRGAQVNPKLKSPLFERTPLEAACAGGHEAMAELLLRHGAQIYRKRKCEVFPDEQEHRLVNRVFTVPSALYRAVESGDVATVEMLVQHGADLRDENARQEALSCHGVHYETLLHRAASADNSRSPEMIEYLVNHGAELNAKDSIGDTPLKYSVRKRKVDAVRKLLELGASVNVKDSAGYTPLDLVDGEKSEVAILLRHHGGKLGKDV
jgi:ankyrin repeat protein